MANNKVVYGNTTIMDITDTTAEAADVAAGEVFYGRDGVRTVGTGDYMDKVENPTANEVLITDANGQAVGSGVLIGNVVQITDLPGQATDTVLGLIKLNPSESVDVNASGQLTVGGRLGQFPDGGLYYPTSADPVAVGNYTLLMSEAKGLSAAHRELIIAGGSTVTLKSAAAAGATQYRISNTQNNRFVCLGWVDGRLAVDEAGAKEKTVAITSVKFANGNDISAYYGATESNNDIIITVAETLNPSGTLSSVRGYGTWKNADIVSAGQGNYVGGGKVLQVGQANVSANNKNQIGMIGIRQYCEGASSLLVGADNINKKAFCALFGQGIENASGPEGLAAFGKWPTISSDTAFVIGNGTAYNARSNLFEIKTNGDVYVNGVIKITG